MKHSFLVQTVVLLFFTLALSCQSNKIYTANTIPAECLEFGTDDANTGLKVSWIFLENGQVFYRTNLFTVSQKSLSRSAVKKLFAEANRIKRSGFKFRAEGAYRAFITFKEVSHQNEFTWIWPYGGTKDYPDELKKLYKLCEEAAQLSKEEIKID